MINYYHVLGLSEDATPEEIKAAFKKLAVKYHPDKHPGRSDMEEKFKEVNQAHQILSDPYEKARFDLKLKYQQFSDSQSTRPPAYGYQRTRHYQRPPYTQSSRPYSKTDHRQNAIATAYAFGITFLIAAIVMGTVWAKRSYDDIQYQKVLDERRATFEEAKEAFNAGNYDDAYEVMTQFKFFNYEESDMKAFKRTMVDQIIKKGDNSMLQGDYTSAISLYNQVFDLKPELPWFRVKKNLAKAHKLTGNVEESVAILKSFLVEEFEVVASLVELAEIHRDYLKDYEESMETFQLAHRLAIKRYKRFYGEAYPILIEQEYVPKSHYRLYTGLADMYLRLDDPNMAIKASDWNKYVWPDSIPAYKTTAESYMAMGDFDNACKEFKDAKDRGWLGESPINCD